MATTSLSLSEVTAFNKLTKGKRKTKGSKKKEEILTSKSKSKTKLSKESSSTELASSKPLVSRVHEPVWDTEYSEELSVPVPDLYPELSDSLPNMQESDTEQEAMAKVSQPHCDSEDNVQCVPTSCGDNDFVDDSHNNPGTSQSQEDSQISNSHSQTKRKRKLAKPRKVRKRQSTDHVQDTSTSKEDPEHPDHCQVSGKQGTWAQCTISSCGKWRFLQNNIDPNEIPERWVCSMNQNDKYNECNVSQETFDSQDGNLDVMYTPYTSGSIVWAKMVGYPWWPAMMEDDPDYGYYCETDEDDVTPLMYHVVFFDKEVSRTWVNAACIRNFSCDDDPEDMGKVTFKGKNYRRKLTSATLAARRAAELPLQRRLAEYGFATRYKGPIGKKAVEEKERSVSLEAEEFSDSVTESDIVSSGHSYSSGNSCSSPDEIKRVKPKLPNKSKSPKEKPANKPNKSKPKKVQQTKQTDAPNKKKETGKKKTKKTTSEALVATHSNSKECSPENNEVTSVDCEIQPTDMNEPIYEHYIKGNQNKSEDTAVLLTEETDPSVPSTLSYKTDSEEATCKNNNSVNKPSAKKISNNNSSETKVVKKRRMSGEAQGGKKRKISKDVSAENNVLGTDSAESKEQKPDVNAVASSESLVITQKKRNASEESKQKKTKNIDKKAKESVSQDKLVGEEAKDDNQSLDTEVKGKESKRKDADCLNIKALKLSKKKRAASSFEEKECRKSRNSNEEGASTSEVSDQKRTDGVQPKQHVISHKPSFALKRSHACTDVRVTLSENNSRKKSLPKLVKAFKPPIAKEGKGPKMPKLLKPQFVSPALVKTGGKQESNNVKKSCGTVKTLKLKSKAAQTKDHNLGQTPKKTKEEHDQANDFLPEDLQAEIEEIDNDIASMQKELRVSDTSDTSISEERIVSPTADRQVLSDSPEF